MVLNFRKKLNILISSNIYIYVCSTFIIFYKFIIKRYKKLWKGFIF